MKNPNADLPFLTFVATQAALQAGSLLQKGFGSTYQLTVKPGHQNYATQYDHAAEKSILALIKRHFPDHAFLAEESGFSNHSEKQDAVLWVVDPLDGTTNFAHHIPLFTVSIAATYHGEILCGVVYQPLTHELFIAEKGKGAFLNGEPLKVSQIERIHDSVMCVSFPSVHKAGEQRGVDCLAELNKLGVSFRNFGSAALALAYVAAGKLDCFWMDQLYPWDIAAGKLLIQEAGGSITTYNQRTQALDSPTSVIAGNPKLHQDLLQRINPTKI